MQSHLSHLVAVVTRPADQAVELVHLIRQAGGRAVSFPTLEIAAITDTTLLERRVKQIGSGDWVIFVSANAVKFGTTLLKSAGVDSRRIKIISIGQATSRALMEHGLRVDLTCPAPASSESLLATPDMQAVSGRRIFICRGLGGRPLLRRVLLDRGALVEYVECYQRRLPQVDSSRLEPTLENDAFNVIVTTSVDGLQNFMDIVAHNEYDYLLNSELVVIGERQRRAADRLGWRGNVTVVEDAGNEQILEKLVALASSRS